mmetsp:Transcript_15308/g.51482  ORF Transcript_15308/g.51482 Transcript_15308/m.51482 type:complete len:342 (-) Transcript_15308:295-1320(-)
MLRVDLQQVCGAVRVRQRRQLEAELLLQAFDHGDAGPGRLEVDLHGLAPQRLERDLVRAVDLVNHLRDHVLRQVHEVVVVHVGHVELARRELRVVREVHPFVAELPPDFVDAVQPSNHKLFQVELRGDAHEDVHLQFVEVRHERLGDSPAGDHVHHGRLDFKKSAFVQILANRRDDARARLEDLGAAFVDHEVEVALAVARLLVLQDARALALWQHVEAGAEQNDALGEERQLASLRFPRVADDADDVAAAELLVDVAPGGFRLVRGGIGHDLNLMPASVQVVKHQLPLPGLAHGAAGDHLLGLEAVPGFQSAVLGFEFGDRSRHLELVRPGRGHGPVLLG